MRIEFENVGFNYVSMTAAPFTALSGLSFRIESGEMVAVVGASGSGKTTLIQHMNGLLRAASGSVRIGEHDLTDPSADLHGLRSHVGVVFQFPEIQLFEETVALDVAFGPRNLCWTQDKVREHVASAMDMVGLDVSVFGPMNPFQLSGGERRRVAIAGVLAMDPSVLVLDEPTAGLDWRGTQKIETILRHYHRIGRTVIFVSHDMDMVARLADRVLVLNRGRLIFDGTKQALFREEKLLEEAGLETPYLVRALRKIASMGVRVPEDVYSMEEVRTRLKIKD
ncbi:energy-coupling factor transporter ATPase [bacterium]|nr:energy-coupling factor transporter ATPase [bacterium]